MDSVEEFIQGEVNYFLSVADKLTEHATLSMIDFRNDVKRKLADKCGDYVFTMDDYIRQVEMVLNSMNRANDCMRMMNRYKTEHPCSSTDKSV